MLNLHNAEFLRSAVKESDFPSNRLPQVVFAGKSNVGKSSVINKLLGDVYKRQPPLGKPAPRGRGCA